MTLTTSRGRRRLRRLATRLTAVVTAVAALSLTGCGSDTGTPTLTWYINPDDGGQETIAQKCTDASGGKYRIKTSLLPSDAPGQREQLIRRLASHDSSIDIMSLDPVFVAEMAQADYLAPVPAQYEQEFTEGVNEASVDSSTRQDQLVAAPFWANTQLLWYRKSVAKEAGLDMSKPVTWDQVIAAAQQSDRLLGAQGIRAESLTVWVNALVESGGGHIVENPDAERPEDVKLGLDSEAGKKAAKVVGTIGKEGLAGPTFSNLDENNTMLGFQGDDGGFMVNWPFVYAAMKKGAEEGTLDKSVLDDVGWALYPRVDADRAAAPPFGGIELGVGAFGEHQAESFEAVKCIRSKDNQIEYFLTDGNAPSLLAAFDDSRIREELPAAATIKQSLAMAKARPTTPYYNEVTGGVQKTWHPPQDVSPDSTPADSANYIYEVLRGERLL
ncbi:extracellular solute-binding protein [Brevibacterium sp. BRM-1]|uniref:extracellular solute-binding protein n=1 Tax=Brevibacterium sp. BRM-1 TaxID=2999062 RepID=UPI00227F925F|nr:extracellular solute-binding protein [Brevibacterium sp. BRM-1]WAL41511.1 extracellular solute-binding protein [Brevibacterium sp. BRM-1]